MSNNNENGAGEPESKATSTDDIIEQLAQEMGVEAGSTDEEASSDAAPEAPAPEQETRPVSKPEPAPKAADKKSDKKGDKKAEAKAAAPAHDLNHPDAALFVDHVHKKFEHDHNNSEAISYVFSGNGDETPLRPHVHVIEDDAPKSRGGLWFGGIVAVGVVAVVGTYFALSPERKECFRLELTQGAGACQQYHEVLEQERVEAERLARLAAAPKYGTLTIVTSPQAMRVSAPGQPEYIFPGTRTDVMVPTRTRIQFENISVSEPFTFTIHGEGNFQDKVVTIPPFSDVESPWVQNQFSGDYAAERTYDVCWPGSPGVGSDNCIDPVPARAGELYWRANWEAPLEVPEGMEEIPGRLLGSINVTSEPSGALIAFNGKQVCDMATGEPLRTPATFSQFFACDDVLAAQEAAAAAAAAGTPAEGTGAATPRIREVFLAREGLPIQVLLDGKVPTTDGVFRHHFQCNPVEGRTEPVATPEAPNPDYLGYCNYTYALHLTLQDPPPPAAEGSGDGSGAAAGTGTGAAAE